MRLSPDKKTLAIFKPNEEILFVNINNLISGENPKKIKAKTRAFDWSPDGNNFITSALEEVADSANSECWRGSLDIYDTQGNKFEKLLKQEDLPEEQAFKILDISWSSKVLQ